MSGLHLKIEVMLCGHVSTDQRQLRRGRLPLHSLNFNKYYTKTCNIRVGQRLREKNAGESHMLSESSFFLICQTWTIILF